MRRWILVLPLLVGLGCGEREPVKPEPPLAAPVLLSVSPEPWTLVSDTTTVEVRAENAAIVSFHLGNSVLGSDETPPFVLAWETGKTPNGIRSLTIRGTNDAGTADTTITYMVGNLGGERVVVVFPQSASVGPQGTSQFSAEVLGAADKRVDWSLRPVDELESEADLGAIDSTGRYRAPKIIPRSGQVLVTAITVENPKRGDAAEVSLSQGIAIELISAPETVYLGRAYPLEAKVYGTQDHRVLWSVDEGPSHGTIDDAGHYHAPLAMPGTSQVTIRAASLADPLESDTATADLAEVIGVSISPQSALLAGGGTHLFSVTVENTDITEVDWSVQGGTGFGTISSHGLYAAPTILPDPPTVTILARSIVDAEAADSASVELLPAPPAGESERIPEMFWAGYTAAVISDQVTGIVFHALELARSLGGGEGTTAGTVRQTAGGWTYDPNPSDRLVIEPTTGPTWNIDVHAYGRNPWSYPDEYFPTSGYGYRDTLDCVVSIDGHSLRLTSRPLTEEPFGKPGCVMSDSDFLRTLEGSIGSSGGESWSLDIRHQGDAAYGSCGWGTGGTVDGHVATASSMDVSLDYEFRIAALCADAPGRCAWMWEFGVDMEAVWGGREYTWEGAAVKGYAGYPACYAMKVEHADKWAAEGSLSKDGSPYGRIYFDGPVIDGADLSANARLDYSYGHSVLLAPPDVPDWHGVVTVVPNPFR